MIWWFAWTNDLFLKLNLKHNISINYEILDYEVQEYMLDNENYTINPLNLMCNEIEANVNLFIGSKFWFKKID